MQNPNSSLPRRQRAPMALQPLPPTGVIRQHLPKLRPKRPGMVMLPQVRQLMHHHVLDRLQRQHRQAQTEIQGSLHRARPPAPLRAIHPERAHPQPVLRRVHVHHALHDPPCLLPVKFFEPLPALALAAPGQHDRLPRQYGRPARRGFKTQRQFLAQVQQWLPLRILVRRGRHRQPGHFPARVL